MLKTMQQKLNSKKYGKIKINEQSFNLIMCDLKQKIN